MFPLKKSGSYSRPSNHSAHLQRLSNTLAKYFIITSARRLLLLLFNVRLCFYPEPWICLFLNKLFSSTMSPTKTVTCSLVNFESYNKIWYLSLQKFMTCMNFFFSIFISFFSFSFTKDFCQCCFVQRWWAWPSRFLKDCWWKQLKALTFNFQH